MIAEKYVQFIAESTHSNVITDQQERIIEITIDGLDNSSLATLWNTLNGIDTKPFFKIDGYYKHIQGTAVMQVTDINYSKQTVRCSYFYEINRKNDYVESTNLNAAEYMFWEEITKEELMEWKKANPAQETKAQTQYED